MKKAIFNLFIVLWASVVAVVRFVVFGPEKSFDHSGHAAHTPGKVKQAASSAKAWMHRWFSLLQNSPAYN